MVEPKTRYENLVRQHFRSFYVQTKGRKVAKKIKIVKFLLAVGVSYFSRFRFDPFKPFLMM